MNKFTALKEAIAIVSPNYIDIIRKYNDNAKKYGKKSSNIEITPDSFLQLLSNNTYNLKDLGLSPGTINKLLKELVPNRPTAVKLCNYLLQSVGLKYCTKCSQALFTECFRPNKSHSDGLNTYCKVCHLETTAETQNGRQAEYRAAKLKRTVPWSELEQIKEFVNACPKGYAVDHIIPLQGELVSGLHVLSNLQYLPAAENSAKRNKFMVE